MERAEFIWGRILFWGIVRTCEIFSVKASMRKLRFSKRQDRTDCSVLCHSWSRTNSSIFQFTLWRWLLTMFVRVFVFLHSVFSLSVLLSEIVLVIFCWLVIYCSFLVLWFLIENFFDYFSKVIVAVKLLQMQWLFWYAMLLVLINCWVRVVSVSSVFSFSTFDNDFKLIMITILLLLRLRLFVSAFFFKSEWFLINLNCILSRRRTLQSVTSRGFRMSFRERRRRRLQTGK